MASLRKLCQPTFRKFVLGLVLLYFAIIRWGYPDLISTWLQFGGLMSRRRADVDYADTQARMTRRRGPRVWTPWRPRVVYVRNHDVNFTVGRAQYVPSDDVIDVPPFYGPCPGAYESFTYVGPQVYVYSVYWDPRQNDVDNDDDGVFLRIMALVNRTLGVARAPIYCVFKTPTGEQLPVLATYYEMCENHGAYWGGFVLSCRVPRFVYGADRLTAPCHVQLSPSMYPRHEQLFKIINTAPVVQQRDFTICVPPLFGKLPTAHVMEFMELTRLLGASHVMLYDFSVSPHVLSLVAYYESIGLATVLPWKLSEDVNEAVWYHAQLVAAMDCLYRNMALSRLVVFADLDEYIVPYLHANWYDMIDYINSNDSCGFQVNSVFVDPYAQNRSSESKLESDELRTLTDTWRTIRPDTVRTKCIVKPQLIFETGIHHVSRPVLARYLVQRVSYPVALLHHHRLCTMRFGVDCIGMVDDVVVPRRYSRVLPLLVQQRQARFGLSDFSYEL